VNYGIELLEKGENMMVFGNRTMKFLIIISTIILIDLIYFEIAKPENDTQIIIDKNLRPGMPLKDAIELLGPPERIQVSKIGTVVLPYNTHGLSIEVMSDGTIIEGIHLRSTFKGQFDSGLEIGVDFQKILSVYNQPDIMTKDIIEYSDIARIFQIHQGRLVGADLYSGNNILYRQVSIKETGKYEEVRKEVLKEIRVFDLFGFEVKNTHEGVVITEIRPGSVAEYGDLKVGERIRKAALKDYGVRNIYSVGGLENILKKAIRKGKKTVNILQDKNYYYIVEVPKRK
jgi:hypothetical protein